MSSFDLPHHHPDMSETELMLHGYGQTTAEFFYRLPDFKFVLAPPFIWQFYDVSPEYPRLFEFIEFWRREIEGPLHSVRFAHLRLNRPGEWCNVAGEFYVN